MCVDVDSTSVFEEAAFAHVGQEAELDIVAVLSIIAKPLFFSLSENTKVVWHR